jgi:formylmethanofuran dehydrogenase subunit E
MVDEETKQKLLNEISKFGNVYLSCLKIGVDKATYYRWKQQDEKFKKEASGAEKIGRENISDVAEHSLLKNVKDGNQKAIEYTLGHNSKKYRQKRSNVVIVHKKDFTPAVREPTLHEILTVQQKIWEEAEKEIQEHDKKEEEEKIEREKQKLIREGRWEKEHENIERIPPDHELE